MSEVPLTSSDLAQTDNETSLDIGDLRRSYAFSSKRLARLNISVDPLFHILAEKRNESVAETHFKITEERPFLWKRYAYVIDTKTWTGSGSVPVAGYTSDDDIIGVTGLTPQTQGTYMALKMGTDYLSSGNRQNIYGQSATEITIGDSGTLPTFFLVNQIIKINTKSGTSDLIADDFFTVRIMDVQTSGQYAYLGCIVVKALTSASNKYLCSWPGGTVVSETYTYALGHGVGDTLTHLETMRTYVVGNAHASGSGLPGHYKTQPFSTRYGLTMIQKQALAMDNSAMATETKIVANEFQRLWAEKVLLHKWDIGNEIYFSTLYEESGSGIRHTQGIVDWCINYGNVFSLATTTNQDNFLEDLSTLTDPRYNKMQNMLFVCSTYYYNWLHKLAGYALQNLKTGLIGSTATYYYYDFSRVGSRKLLGAEIFEFGTLFGPMRVLRDIHLDGTHVKMLGIPLNQIVYRPLSGNGINRDTTIYTGVNRIENTGVDSTSNLIMTEFGIELTLPESWAIWK